MDAGAGSRDPGQRGRAPPSGSRAIAPGRLIPGRPRKLTLGHPLPLPLDGSEASGPIQLGRVCYDEEEERFRLYYTFRRHGRQVMGALDSADGWHWERPAAMTGEATDCPPGALLVFWDPHETDETRRWKRIDNRPTGRGPDGAPEWRAFHSSDGCRWQAFPRGRHSAQKMLFNFGAPAETFGGVIDPDARYICYSQRGSNRRTRVLGRRDSADALNWSGLRTVIDQDLDDPPGTEFYSAAFDPANRTDGGLHVLMLHTFHTDLAEPYQIRDPERYWGGEPGPAALAARVDGFVDTQLALSRDTVAWQRLRQPLIRRGDPGAWDWGMLFADAPIQHDGRLWLFYTADRLTHNGRSHRPAEGRYPEPKTWGKGLATLRVDGWVGVEAESFAPGRLTTHRFRQAAGGRVRVNVDAAGGELRYELLEDTGAPIPGCGLDDCQPIRTDDLAAELRWQGRPGWPAVPPERRRRYPGLSPDEFYVKLRFHIAPGTKLYSVTLDPPEVAVWPATLSGRLD